MIKAKLNQMRDWTAMRLLRRIHRVTHRLVISLRQVEPSRVLVFAPHMDDGMISSGGTLALHKQVGSDVGIVYVSDSNGDSRYTGVDSQTAVRQQEAINACSSMGIEIVDMLGYPDRKLSLYEPKMIERISEILEKQQPLQIFCPFPTDHHRDHQATSMAVALAAVQSNWKGEIWGYEVWSTLWPNTAVDISSVVQKKSEVIAKFESQVAGMQYIEASLGLNRYRGLQANVDYAEAFYVSSPKKFLQMCETLNQL